ncbi:hypothetical protein [Bacillus massiliigorillae]|uniref:hypothetical protein n=1 Tax=Bacillus massiliigorillae TaxID=1243664 RepID=UPI0003A8993B|nr:hypothetical protein [Bacillus massiliigorillae]
MGRKSVFFYVSLIVLTIIYLLHIFESSRNVSNLKKVANEIRQSYPFNYFIENIDIQYSHFTTEINLELINQYDELELINQFAIFEYFQRQLRHFLLTGDYQNPLHISDFKLVGNTDSNKYFLSSDIPENRTVHYNVENFFYINNKKSYHTNTLDNSLYNKLKDEGKFDLEVLQYADCMFRLITSGGRNYIHKTDEKIILDSISEKFGITHEEFNHIYYKYYLGIYFNPLLDDSNL